MKRVVPVVAALLLAACSPSAVPAPQSQGPAQVPPAQRQTSTAPGQSAPVLPGAPVPTTNSPQQQLPTSTGTGTIVPTPSLAGVPIVTDTSPVRVGVLSQQDARPTLGVQVVTMGDTQAQAAAVVDWINAHNGMAGRRVARLSYEIPATDASRDPAIAQLAGCNALVEVRVQFVVSVLPLFTNTLECFATAGVIVLDDVSTPAAETPEVQKHFYAPGSFTAARLMSELVERLWATGWLTAGSKVGAFTSDTSENREAVAKALVPALAVHGLSLAERAFVTGASAQAGNVATRFRNAGVDRVIPVLTSPLALMNAANNVGYVPRYALYSSLAPGGLLESTAPKAQLAGSLGIGWQPYVDIGTGSHPRPVSANETLCFGLMKTAGQPSTTSSINNAQASICNVLLYLASAAKTVGYVPADLLDQAALKLGASFPPANTFRVNMTSRHDGAAGFRTLLFKGDCSCFQYLGAVRFTR